MLQVCHTACVTAEHFQQGWPLCPAVIRPDRGCLRVSFPSGCITGGPHPGQGCRAWLRIQTGPQCHIALQCFTFALGMSCAGVAGRPFRGAAAGKPDSPSMSESGFSGKARGGGRRANPDCRIFLQMPRILGCCGEWLSSKLLKNQLIDFLAWGLQNTGRQQGWATCGAKTSTSPMLKTNPRQALW